jgi:hypothetical protein
MVMVIVTVMVKGMDIMMRMESQVKINNI